MPTWKREFPYLELVCGPRNWCVGGGLEGVAKGDVVQALLNIRQAKGRRGHLVLRRGRSE
jgi:hypothetical protein